MKSQPTADFYLGTALHVLSEPSPILSDGGQPIGRDPRTLTEDEWRRAGVGYVTALPAIRAKCLDCCCGDMAEVRKCLSVACPLWPLRMGSYPKGLRAFARTDAETDSAT